MPWKDTDAMQERIQFISDWLKRIDTFSDLCARYDISRKSGYKWIDRYLREGPDWVLDRSHAARVIANKTPLEVEQKLLKRIPPEYLVDAHHWLILHGRYICQARKPLCGQCGVSAYCDFYAQSK